MISKENYENSRYDQPYVPDLKRIFIDKDCMKDPVNDGFYLDTWQAVAEKNTKIYRSVFRCMPDSEVKNWKEYKEYAAYGERFAEMQSHQSSKAFNPPQQRQTGPPGAGSSVLANALSSPISLVSPKTDGPKFDEKAEPPTSNASRNNADRPLSEVAKEEPLSVINEKSAFKTASEPHLLSGAQNGHSDENPIAVEDAEKQRSNSAHVDYSEAVNLNAASNSRRRRRRGTTIGSKREFHATDEVMDKQHAEDLLNKVQGHLILWPYDWYVIM